MKIMRSIKSFFWDLSTPGIGFRRILSFRFLLPVVLIGLVLVVAFSVATIEFTGQNFFCGSCHEMTEHYRTWKVSAHKEVDCIDCHISPGIINMVKTKVAALREVYVHIAEDKGFEEIKEGIKVRVPDENCKECHKDTQNLIVYHSLKITHKDHWERGISCVECHSRVVHGPRAEYKNTPSMETCRTCHDGEKAPDECGTCHVTLGSRAPSTFDPGWVDAHKIDVQQNKNSCMRCHHQEFCNACHTSAKPHAPEWFSIHNVEAKKGVESCRTCHQERYCSNCHDIRKEHSLNWLEIHNVEAKKDRQDCDRCHKENFCADCHTKFVRHPDGWLENHGSKAEDDPESCDACHTIDFCATCHE
jgi:nitrate/TMAO reductase-like tetraheme cytochrome c subunit